jgi:adenylate cyclase
MSESGTERLDELMSLVDEIEAEVSGFERVLLATGDIGERIVGRVERMKRGVTNLRSEAVERLEAAGFEHVESDDDDHYRTIRHDLRNRLNPVSLAGQGLMRGLAKVNDGAGASREAMESLDRVQVQINECLKLIDAYGVKPEQVLVDIEPGEARVTAHGQSYTARPELERVSMTDNGSVPLKAANAETGEWEPRFTGRLLVVDDSVDDREELVETLREAGHEVFAAGDGREALQMLTAADADEDEAADFDVVLLDLSMPGMDGKEVLRELRRIGKLKYLPVIVVTGRRGEDDAVDCITIGAEGFLTKPVRSKLLLAEVDRCLEKRRLREREFEQFFPPSVARHFARHPDSSEMEAREAEVTVLFADIRGFSGISERLGGYRTVPWLRDVLECLSQCVVEHEGVLVDYTGDEVMAMWGAPRQVDDHHERACDTALAMLDALPGINDRWQEEVGSETSIGIGINSGLAHVGNIGTQRKLKYGPLGNTVNLASRVQGASSYAKTRLIITRETRVGLPEKWHARTRQLCDVRVKNIVEPVRLYELATSSRHKWDRIKESYEMALEEFHQERFPESLATLGNLLRECPDDGPSLLLMGRVVDAMSHEERAFDPVWQLPGK